MQNVREETLTFTYVKFQSDFSWIHLFILNLFWTQTFFVRLTINMRNPSFPEKSWMLIYRIYKENRGNKKSLSGMEWIFYEIFN